MGNKNYSSWSLRPWILMKHLGLEFTERVLPLDTPDFARAVAGIEPDAPRAHAASWRLAGVGFTGDLRVCLRTRGPRLARRTGRARRGALGLRRNAFRLQHAALTMANERARGGSAHARRSPERAAEIARIEAIVERVPPEIWRSRCPGCSATTALRTPCTHRWCCASGPMERAAAELAAEYMATVLGDAHLREWLAAAAAETWTIEGSEIGRPDSNE